MWKRRRADEKSGQGISETRTGPLRWKTYSAETGYVYQYVLRGSRPWRQGTTEGLEYVFHASRDRREVFAVSVVLTAPVLVEWGRDNTRKLRPAECYAVAKLSLQAAFDEFETTDRFAAPIMPGPEAIDHHLKKLGLETTAD